jgi:uncharacterized membrane protein
VLDGSFFRALALLAGSGASLALFGQELRGIWLSDFVRKNALSLANRNRLGATMAAGALAGILVGAVIAWRRGTPALQRLAHVLAPSLALGLLPPLMMRGSWDALPAALAIGCFVLLFERLLRMSFRALAPAQAPTMAAESPWAASISLPELPALVRRWLPLGLVVLMALGYGVYMSRFTLYMHGRFQTYGYDLGQYDNIFFSALHGHPLRCAPLNLTENWTELRNHAEFSVFALLPFYALRPRADTLLIIQSMILGLGAIPVYRIAARRIPQGGAVILALAYLLYPPMHGLQFYDFHFQPVAAFFVLLVIDFVDDRRYLLCGVALVIALGCREDISVGLAILGAFLALSGHRVRPGIVMAAVSAAYFVLIRFVIMPRFGSWFFQDIYKGLFPQGAENFGGVIGTLITNPTFVFVSLLTPEKLRYALQVIVPLAFLPLRRSYLAVAVIPGSIFTLMTTAYNPTIDIGFQYGGHFIPYCFAAAGLALAAYGQTAEGAVRRRAALVSLMTATILCGVFWGAIPPRQKIHGGFHDLTMDPPTEADRQRHRDLQELFAMIPKDKFVAISEAEMPHVSGLNILSLRDTSEADYLLYGTSTGFFGSDRADRVIGEGRFAVVAERPGLALAHRTPFVTPP